VYCDTAPSVTQAVLTWPGHHVGDRRADAAVRHVRDGGAGFLVQPLGHDVHRRTGAGAGVAEGLARLGGGDHLGNRLHADAGVGHQHQRLGGGLDDRLEAVQHVVAGRCGQAHHHRRGGERVRREQQRVAVGRRAADEGVADGAAGARLVVDHHRLVQALGQLVGEQARDGVGVAAGRVADHDGDRLGRIGD
jgi:hypothetical protein